MQKENRHPQLLRLGSNLSTNQSIFSSPTTTTSSCSDSDGGPAVIFTDPCSHCGRKRHRSSLSSSPLHHQQQPFSATTNTKKIFIDPSSIQKDPTTTITTPPHASKQSNSFSGRKSPEIFLFNLGSISGSSGRSNKSPEEEEEAAQPQPPHSIAEKKILTASAAKEDDNDQKKKKWKLMMEGLEEMNKLVASMIQEPIPTKEETNIDETVGCVVSSQKDKVGRDGDGEDNKAMKVTYRCNCGIKHQIGLQDLTLSIQPFSSD